MKAAALKGALSDRARNGRIHVVESLVSGDTPSTKAALAALTGLVADRTNFLLVLERSDALTWLSLQPEVDPNRLGVWGSSFSGAHVIQVTAHDPRVKAVVSQVGPMDLDQIT